MPAAKLSELLLRNYILTKPLQNLILIHQIA
jgi:hypothetical protein